MKDKIIRNEEHFEAYQAESNKEREEFVKTLPLEDQAKFKAVEKAVKILIDNNVQFYLFPLLKSWTNKKNIVERVWQWNSLSRFVEYDKAGKPTEESDQRNGFFHDRLFYAIYSQFEGIAKGRNFYDTITNLGHLIACCVTRVIDFNAKLDEQPPGE